MSDWEFGVLRQRSVEALRLKASRGELFTTVPIPGRQQLISKF